MRLVAVLLLLVASAAVASTRLPETPQFRRIGIEQGLPSSRINGLAQDRDGYLWIATDDGLARFDGVSMRVWRHNPGIVGGMPDNLVNALHVDRNDEVWMGHSTGGVGRIDVRRREVRPLSPEEAGELSRADVWAFAETGDGSLWFATFGQGLFRRDADGRFEALGAVPTGRDAKKQERLVTLATAGDGSVWIGTVAGLARAVEGRIEPVSAGALDGEAITNINAEPDGSLWISTRSRLWRRTPEGRFEPSPWAATLGDVRVHGVQRDSRGGRWVHTARGLHYDPGDGLRRFTVAEAVEGNYQQMLVDHQGGLWFGDAEYGLVWLSGYWRSFATLSQQGSPPLQVSMRQATAFTRDPQGRVLMGGEDGRLDRFDPRQGIVERGIVPPERFEGSRLFSLAQHPDGALWIGTGRLLLRRDAQDRWQRWSSEGDDPLPPGSIDAILPMPGGEVWIAAYGGGLQQRSAEGRVTLEVRPGSGHGFETPDIEALVLGPDGAPWVANSQGVLRWNGTRFEVQVDGAEGTVQGLAFVDAGEFWVYRPGLLQRWRREAGEWRKVDEAGSGNDGLPAAEAGGLVRDAAGRLWIFTVRGLLRFDPGTRSLRRFGPGDGLRETEFGLRPPVVLDDGVVLAGSIGGAVMFHPMHVAPDARVGSLVLESVSVRRAEDLIELDPAGPITLEPEDRDLRIVARLMSFAEPAAHRYRFRLDGYDPDWVDVGAGGERLLPRQAAGRHTLHIVASGADGRWTEPRALNFVVQPPWWFTPWAWAVYVLLLLASGSLVAWLVRRRVHVQSEQRALLEARRLAQSASDAKTAFLADLGHELRTPLTGVLGMTELLLKSALTDEQRQRAETAQRAGQHLLRLVNDTLDLARIEAGRLSLQDEAFDLPALAADCAQLLRPAAEAKGLAFAVALAPGLPPRVRGDEARLRQILLNLGGNAIKFTEQGQVTLRAQPVDGGVSFEIEDTGIGLDDAQQQRLFQRFTQAEGELTQRRFGGTGLGLAISRELARAMGGDLQLRSRKGEGSCFSVQLPLPAVAAAPGSGASLAAPSAGDRSPAEPGARRALDVLLVEDDPIVAEVLIALLVEHGHRVHHATQALAALALLSTTRIDVGLLDLDLPAVDGFELATMIRQQGWMLPLIAVTARADPISERRARAAGMDGYLRKPISGAMLAEALAVLRIEVD